MKLPYTDYEMSEMSDFKQMYLIAKYDLNNSLYNDALYHLNNPNIIKAKFFITKLFNLFIKYKVKQYERKYPEELL